MQTLDPAVQSAADALLRDLPEWALEAKTSAPLALAGNAAAGAVKIILYGEVGYEITPESVAAALDEANGADITVHVNSPGGNAFHGLAIFNSLLRYPGRKTMVVDGIAASAASHIAMAGDEIQMNEASFLMIHNSSGLTMGTSTDHADSMALLERMDAMQATIYSARTGLPVEEVRTMMAAETWMTGTEAVERGFATSVVSIPQPTASAGATPHAAALIRAFAHAPAAVMAMATAPAARVAAAPTTPAASPAPEPAQPAPSTLETNTMSAPAANPPAGGAAAVNVIVEPPVVIPPAVNLHTAASLEMLQSIAARARLNSDWVVAQLVAKATESQARDAALESLANSAPQRGAIIGGTSTGLDTSRAIVASIAKRGGVKDPAVIAAAGPMDGMSLRDMAADFHEMRTGQRARLAPETLFRNVFASATVGMNTTSDFGDLLNQSVAAIVRDTAQRVSTEWRKIGRTYAFDNFRQRDVAGGFDAPDLEEVLEHGEIRYGTIARALGKLGLKTFAKGFAFSRQAIINNDLTQFTADSAAYGAMAARSLSSRVWRVWQLGTTAEMRMTDGQPFLSAAHGNLAAVGGPITEASLAAAEIALAQQAAVPGKPLGLGARYLLVGINRRREALKILNSEQIGTGGDQSINTFRGTYELIYEPTFPADAWALLADPDTHPVIAVSLLNGVETPSVITEASFDTFGLKVRVSLDYEAAPIDWNGVYFNPGA